MTFKHLSPTPVRRDVNGPLVTLALIVAVLLIITFVGKWVASPASAPQFRPPRVYNDSIRGVTCYVFQAGVSCVPDANLYPVR